jgi:50S ribosomal protein L16 3-hydroxylase
MRFSMTKTQSLPLLGGLSPQQFMRRHWQKKPLLVRGALPGFGPILTRAELFTSAGGTRWSRARSRRRAANGAFAGAVGRRAYSPLSQPG